MTEDETTPTKESTRVAPNWKWLRDQLEARKDSREWVAVTQDVTRSKGNTLCHRLRQGKIYDWTYLEACKTQMPPTPEGLEDRWTVWARLAE